jgi:membrane protease YdiL (CAAX protease family)
MSTDTAEPRERPPYWLALGALVLGFAVYAVLSTVVIAVTGSSTAHPSPAASNISNFIFDLSFVGAALYFTTVSRRIGRLEFGYRRISWRTGLTALIAAGAAYYALTLVYSAVFSLHATDRLPSGLGLHQTSWKIVVAVYVCAMAPMCEEFFFRGFLFGILRRMHITIGGREAGPWVAAAIVGVLFGLAHFDSAQPEFLIPLGFLGFVLCIVRWRTGSLYPCMALHSLNNSVALAVNEHLGWGTGGTIAVVVGSLAVIALVTGPLSARRGVAVSET